MLINKVIRNIIIVFGILMLAAITIYIINFSNNPISQDPLLWGVFGDYIGGVINPLIGIASLIVLGYLTVIMGKQSTDENIKLFKIQQRLLAYQDLVKHISEVNLMTKKLAQSRIKMNYARNLSKELQEQNLLESVERMQEIDFTYFNFYIALCDFQIKYGHLFTYDFNCTDYKELVSMMNKLSEDTFIREKDLIKTGKTEHNNIFDEKRYTELLSSVFNSLKMELI